MSNGNANTVWYKNPAVIAALLALGGSIYAGLSSRGAQQDVARLEAGVQREVLALEQQKFEADQQKLTDDRLVILVPQLLSADDGARRSAAAILFVLYPNEAQMIVDTTREAGTAKQQEALESASEAAEMIAATTGFWAVVVGTASEFGDAVKETEVAAELGFGSTDVFQRGEVFATVVFDFPTEDDAQSALIPIRSDVRESAFVVNLNEWCPNPTDKTEEQPYQICELDEVATTPAP